jgi:hypothetical protein
MIQSKLKTWMDIENYLCPRISRSSLLPKQDSELAAYSLTIWGLVVTELVGAQVLDVQQWLVQLADYPLPDISSKLSEAALWFRSFCRDYPWCNQNSFRTFKRSLGDSPLVHILFSIIRNQICRYLEFPCSSRLSPLLTFCEFWSRIPIGSKELEREARNLYLTTEDTFPTSHRLTSMEISFLQGVVWSFGDSVLASFRESGFRPRFSNGATSEIRRRQGVVAKAECLVVKDGTLQGHLAKQLNLEIDWTDKPRDLVSRWVSVPKNVQKRRSIAAEPTVNAFLQQAVADLMRRALLTPLFSIDLEDQQLNRDLALEGSISRDYATIDLSSASDSIGCTLVSDIVKHPFLRMLLWCTRTKRMDVGGKVIDLKKFCSMGSAVCFPLECLIFRSLILLAEHVSGCVPRQSGVYGDDLIVHESIYSTLLDILSRAGFTVNSNKTFPPYSPFKESCGGEYYAGVEVPVLRLSRSLSLGSHPEDVMSHVATINRFVSYPLTRRYMIAKLNPVGKGIPFTHLEEGYGLVTQNLFPNSRGYSMRYNLPLFRHEIYISRVKVEQEYDYSKSALALQMWLFHADQSLRTTVSSPLDDIRPAYFPISDRWVRTWSSAYEFGW